MATAAKPVAFCEVLLIPANDIEMGQRLRPVDPIWAATLGRVMKVEGQKTPIEVCRLPGKATWHLVSGGHRLQGALFESIDQLKAIEVSNDAIERRMREISENLWRKGLDPLDRAAFVGDMHELLRARAGLSADQSAQSIAANARWQKQVKGDASDASAMIADAYALDAKIGEHLGLSERTIRNDLTLRRRLAHSDLYQLRDIQHPILRNGAQLLALAKLEGRARSETIGLLVAGTVKTVSEALGLLHQKAKPSAEAKALSAFIGSFGRMGLAEKKGALGQLAGMLSAQTADHLITEMKKGGWL